MTAVIWRSRLRAYEPGTDTHLGWLGRPLSYDASIPRNDVGALQLRYTTLAQGGAVLQRDLADGIDIALEVNWGAGWIEPAGCRFSATDRDLDVSDKTGGVTLTATSYAAHLAGLQNNALELLEVGGEHAGKRMYIDATAGAVLGSQLAEYSDRHPGSPFALTWGFTGSLDSYSAPWTVNGSFPVDAHRGGQEILAELVSRGMCDWETIGRTLALSVPDSQVTDLSATVRLEIGRDVGDAPSKESIRDVAGWILIRGEGNVVATHYDPSAPAAWGVREAVLQASGATTEAEAQAAAAADIEQRARARGQYTRQLILDGDARWLPIRDYRPGDVVSAVAVTERQAMRVQQVTLSLSDGKHTGSVVLNDRLVPVELQQRRTLRALANGAAIAAGAGGAVSGEDGRAPAAPGAPALVEDSYQDGYGNWYRRIAASWAAVTVAANGTPMVPARYELWGQPLGRSWARLTTAQDGALAVSWQPFDEGAVWRFAVKAVAASGRPSELGAQHLWTFGHDTVAPPIPATLSVTVWTGTVQCQWNGRSSANGVMPADFSHLVIEESADAGATWTEVGRLIGAGTVIRTGRAYGTEYRYRSKSVDFAGNASAWSTVVSSTPLRITTGDMDAAYTALISTAQATAEARSRNFRTTPTPPYSLGDTWTDAAAGVVRVCTTARASGAYQAGDWTVAAQTADATARAEAAAAADTWTTEPVPPYKTGDLWRDSSSILRVCINSRGAGAFDVNDWALQLVVAEMFAAQVVLTTDLIAGPPTASHTRLNAAGLAALGPNPDNDDEIEPYAGFGIDGMFFGFDPARPKARITAVGHSSFASVATEELSVDGQTLAEILRPLPKGTIAYTAGTSPVTGITTTETAVLELRCILEPDRLYELAMLAISARSSTAADVIEWNVRVAYDGDPVGTSSPLIRASQRNELRPAGLYVVMPQVVTMLSTEGQSGLREARFLLTAKRYSGSGIIDIWGSAGQPMIFELEDEGAYRPPASTAIRYTSTWEPTAGWRHTGPAPDYDSTYDLDLDHALALEIFGNNAIYDLSQLYFGGTAVSGETSMSIAAALAGAALEKAEVRLRIDEAWQYRESDGREYSYKPGLRIHPTSNTTANDTVPGTYLTSDPFSAPQSRWIDVTALWTTAHRGFYVSLPPVASGRWAGTFTEAPIGCELRLTYRR